MSEAKENIVRHGPLTDRTKSLQKLEAIKEDMLRLALIEREMRKASIAA